MTSTPAVSVIVPVYNGGAAVKRLAASLLAQDFPGAIPEILFVDNGSTDGGLEPLAAMPVRVIREERRGAPVARNRGAGAATGGILVFTDHDCLAERRWLKNLVAPFADPRVPAVAGETLAAPAETWPARYLAHIRHNSAEESLRRPVFPFAPTANLAVRKELFDRLGGFDETLPYTDDADFSLRLMMEAGARIAYAPRAIVFHEERSTAAMLFARYRQYGRGWAELLRKHPGELRWGPGLAWNANVDVLKSLAAIPAGLIRWRFRNGAPEDFHFRRLEFLRRFAHRLGFVERSLQRGRLLW